MTLLELLKEHLKEWPENVRCLSQDGCGSINVNTFDKPAPAKSPRNYNGTHVWSHPYWMFRDDPDADDGVLSLPLADDAATSIVTREMWEAV